MFETVAVSNAGHPRSGVGKVERDLAAPPSDTGGPSIGTDCRGLRPVVVLIGRRRDASADRAADRRAAPVAGAEDFFPAPADIRTARHR
jgi:hypothetical protein